LSHRWGSDTPRTLRENIEAHYDEIPYNILSQTFKDAITFLRKFSRWHETAHGEPIRYIWIDSLCIIQDSPDDWEVQSRKMCDIYSNADLTLVESYSAWRDKRLFSQSSPKYISTSPIRVADASGAQRDIYLRHGLLHPDFMVNDGNVPIWTRAWVLQERLLSKRLLFFGSEELAWQCSAANKCECGLDELHTAAHRRMEDWDTEFMTRLPSASSRKALDLILGREPTPSQLRQAWRLILWSYSELHMTFRTDTLPAIAGLAQSFHRMLGGGEETKYLGGLWYEVVEPDKDGRATNMKLAASRETVLDLLWRLHYRSDGLNEETRAAAREGIAGKPTQSWSWAHPQCSVAYPFVNDACTLSYAFVLAMRAAHNVPRRPPAAEADAAYDRPLVRDMFTEAPAAALTLVGAATVALARIWPGGSVKSARPVVVSAVPATSCHVPSANRRCRVMVEPLNVPEASNWPEPPPQVAAAPGACALALVRSCGMVRREARPCPAR